MTYLSMELVGHRRLVPFDKEPAGLHIGQVRIAVRAANLCPTDVKKWDDATLADRLIERGLGLVLGHEFAGVISEVASGAAGLRVGDRVAIDPVLRCGACEQCRLGRPEFCTALLGIGAAAGDPVACAELAGTDGIGGGFAEQVVVPAANCLLLPEDLDFAAGALVEPLSDVMHGIAAAQITRGTAAAVLGLGPMGLLHAEALRASGADVVGADLRADRRDLAGKLGIKAVHPNDLPVSEAVFVTAGGAGHVPATRIALDRLAPGGRIILFSSATKGAVLGIDPNRLHYQRQSVIGVVGFDRAHANRAIEVLRSGAISVETIRQPPTALRDLDAAFASVLEPGVLKTAIEF